MKRSTDNPAALRFLPLVLCLLVAVGTAVPLWAGVLEALVRAVARTGLALLWISGPVLLAIALAFLVRKGGERAVFDAALVAITLTDLGALLLSALPFLGARTVFLHLPFLQFAGLTVLLMLVLLARRRIPELAKGLGSGTLGDT